MKVLICDPVDAGAIKKMQEAGLEVDNKAGISKEELLSSVNNYQALVVRSATKVTKEVIQQGKSLKLIIRGGVGLDNIDTEAARTAKIDVQNTLEASSVSVAELTIGHMFTLTRKIAQADATIKQGRWEKKKLTGGELWKKTLGLIGIGRIGFEVAKRAIGLEMSVIAYDPYLKPVPEKITRLGVKMVPLDELLKNADFISLHLPLTSETRHTISTDAFNKMKKNAILVNCARGGIVDEQTLAEAIESGKIAGAAVDVFEKEPVTSDNPLLTLGEKVVLTPHLGASSFEGQERVGDAVADKLIAYFKKK